MKKIISVLLAIVLVVCMSSVAFAVDSSADTFAAPNYIDLRGVKFTPEQIDFLIEWIDSDCSLLASFLGNYGNNYTFSIVPLDSTLLTNSDLNSLNCSVSVPTLKVYMDSRSVSLLNSTGIDALYKTHPRIHSGAYIGNTVKPLSASIKGFLYSATTKFAIRDDYGIFDGWESSYESPADVYTVSIDYKYEDGTQAAPLVSKRYHLGDTYSITSPAIDGFSPDLVSVDGIITETSASATEHHVIYRDMTRTVNVDYSYLDGTQAALPVSKKYLVGDDYSIPSPVIDGFVSSVPVVSGSVLESFDSVTQIHVVYKVAPRKLTVNYLYEDNTQAAPPFVGYYGQGDDYSITSPKLSGFLPDYPVVRGTVAIDNAADMSFNVVYRVDLSIIKADDFVPFMTGLFQSIALVLFVCFSPFLFLVSIRFIIDFVNFMTRK